MVLLIELQLVFTILHIQYLEKVEHHREFGWLDIMRAQSSTKEIVFQINASTMDATGEILFASGSTSYTSSNENQITLNNLDLTVNSSLVRINGNSLTRNDNIYSAALQSTVGQFMG